MDGGLKARSRLTAAGVTMLLATLVADQASKWWIVDRLDLPALGTVPLTGFLNLTMVWNAGVTFGLLKATGGLQAWLLAGVAFAIVVALGVWLRRAESRLVAVSLGAIAGGAVGNVADRIRFGAVVDFIHLHAAGYSWYVFNVADAAIVCGVAALVLDGLRRPAAGPVAARPQPEPPGGPG